MTRSSVVFVSSDVLKCSSMSEGANLINMGEKKEGEEGGKKSDRAVVDISYLHEG